MDIFVHVTCYPETMPMSRTVKKKKNTSAVRTWGFMLYANMLLLLSVGVIFSNVSIWEFNCYKCEGKQALTVYKWEIYGRILFT